MRNSTIQARVPEELKSEVSEILEQLGLSASEAINIYFRQIVMNKGLPFEVKIPNKETLEAIEEANSGNLKKFKSVDEMFKELGC